MNILLVEQDTRHSDDAMIQQMKTPMEDVGQTEGLLNAALDVRRYSTNWSVRWGRA